MAIGWLQISGFKDNNPFITQLCFFMSIGFVHCDSCYGIHMCTRKIVGEVWFMLTTHWMKRKKKKTQNKTV